jgi:hypothetical protein
MSCVTAVTSPATRERSGRRANALSSLQSGAQSIAVISPTMTAVPVIPQAFTNAGHAHVGVSVREPMISDRTTTRLTIFGDSGPHARPR